MREKKPTKFCPGTRNIAKKDLSITDPDLPMPVNNFDHNFPPTQAGRVFARFGGPHRLLELFRQFGCDLNPETIRRWNYPKSQAKGMGGYIPHKYWDLIFKIARFEGIVFSSEELDPRPYPVQKLKQAQGLID